MTPRDPLNTLTCAQHSGMAAWQKGIATLLLFLCSMHAYSTFKQIPDFRYDVARNMDQLSGRVVQLEYRVASLEREAANIKSQRNADHPGTTPLR